MKLKKLFPMPDFSDATDTRGFRTFFLGTAATISGYWFAQIAFLASIIQITGKKAPVAVYFLCIYFPKLITPLIWQKFLKNFPWKNSLVYSQILGAILTAFQMMEMARGELSLFYLTTLAKGFCDAIIFLVYDSFTVTKIQGENNVNKANAALSMIRYGGITLFPFIGAICTEYFGAQIAITVDGLSFVVAALLYASIPTNYFIQPYPKALQRKIEPIATFKNIRNFTWIKLGTVLINDVAYSIFNYLTPVYVLLISAKGESQLGIVIAISGCTFIMASYLVGSKKISGISPLKRNGLVIMTTILNGLFLLLAFLSKHFGFFALMISLASFVSLLSIVSLKTSILTEKQDNNVLLASLYNSMEWIGTSTGFLLCVFLGELLSVQIMASTIFGILLVGPIFILGYLILLIPKRLLPNGENNEVFRKA